MFMYNSDIYHIGSGWFGCLIRVRILYFEFLFVFYFIIQWQSGQFGNKSFIKNTNSYLLSADILQMQ